MGDLASPWDFQHYGIWDFDENMLELSNSREK